MKRILLLAATAAMTLSCSQDETTAAAGKGPGIDFRACLQTRASETTTANLTGITVTALDKNRNNFFTDVEFSKQGGYFTSDEPYYWPSDGSALTFHAYAPNSATLGATVTIDKTTKKLTDFAPAATISAQQDFITATATGSKSDEATGVALTFSHRLSQVEIKAKNGDDTYVYKVQGVRIAQPVSQGSFDFGANTWTLGTDKAAYEVEYTTAKTLGAAAASLMERDGDNAMLLPQQLTAWNDATDKTNNSKGAYLAVKLNITRKDGGVQIYPAAAGEYGWAAVAIGTNWEPGKKYVYTLDFTNGAGKVDPTEPDRPGEDILGSPIKFSVTVDEWQEASQEVGM